ncbi:MAG TPA: hypothetical protein PKY42_11035, partial [Mesotoga sp.]|nr:hypothetical protein [Mesotoga sp.]
MDRNFRLTHEENWHFDLAKELSLEEPSLERTEEWFFETYKLEKKGEQRPPLFYEYRFSISISTPASVAPVPEAFLQA